jgi:cardiolipin synthase
MPQRLALAGLADSPWRIAPLVVALLDLYVLGRAITRRQGVEATLAWIFAILALPGIGAVAYLLLANPRVRHTTRRMQRAREVVRAAQDLAAEAESRDGAGGPGYEVFALVAAATGLPPRAGQRVELLSRDQDAFECMAAALADAERRIWAEYYIIADDETGKRFLAALAAAAARGVEVRLIYDALGSFRLDHRRLAPIVEAGGRVTPFLPLNPLRRKFAALLRNHRKLIVVDDRLGFTGGMNIGDEYSGFAPKKGKRPFRDSHLGLEGPIVADLALLFAEDWRFATDESLGELGPPPPACGPAIAQLLPSGPDHAWNANALAYFRGISTARHRVWLATAYFVPDEPVLRALQSAALSGVDVRVMVPAQSDVRLLGPAARSYFPALLRAGVRVYEYLPAMLHSKTLVVDSAWGIVGSANADVRSFRLNFEVGALVADAGFARRLEATFEEDQAASREVTLETIARLTRRERLRDGLARLLSPLL